MKRNTVGLQSLPEVRRKAYAAVEAAMQNQLSNNNPKNQFNIMKKNAKPILGGYACVRFPFFRILTLAFLLAATSLAWAQDGYPDYDPTAVAALNEWDGVTNSGSFKITTDKEISSTVTITTGNALYLYPVNDLTDPTNPIIPTITKKVKGTGTSNGVGEAKLFYLYDEGKLYIIGNESNKLNIYGNCGNGTVTNPTPIPDSSTYQGAAIYARNGTPEIWLKHVEFYGFVTHTDMGGGTDGDTHGGIVTMGHHNYATTTNGVCNMDHVTFRTSYGGPIDTNSWEGFGRIISLVNGTWTVTLDNVTIRDCIISEKLHGKHYSIGGMGSVIRSQGNVGGSLTMRNCVAYNNTYRDLSASANHSIFDYTTMQQINAQPLAGQGGVVNWRSGKQLDNNSTQVNIENCDFHHNSARCGGGVATCATINMVNTEIHDNEAVQGGGVYFYTYNGTDALYNGRGFEAIFGNGVKVYNNSATDYGGAAYMTFDASNDVGFYANTEAMSPHFQVQINTGCEIYHNKAPKGAGFAIIDGCPYSHYNNTSNHRKWSLEYRRTVTIDGGKVYNNYAQGTTGDELAGGGIYIEKYEYPSNHQFYSDYAAATNPTTAAQNNSGTINVHLLSGEVYNNSAGNDTIPGPGKGGGVYIASKFMTNTIKSTLNVNIGEMGGNLQALQMYDNQAYTDGGGVYVLYERENGRKNQGTVTVANGTIGMVEKDNNGTIVAYHPNKALNGNGGGICVLGGTVNVHGGHIDWNTASNGLGGGIYISVPNKESMTTVRGGAVISHNTAMGGGGIYVDKGELDVFGDTWNPDANSGAGAWELVEWSGDSYDPTAEATHTRITNNWATDGNGGGINAGNGEVDIFNTLIYYNTADGTVSNGRGGGVYLDGGFIKIYNSKILNNTAETNGGGIDDHSGDIEIYGGDISHNTATNGRGGGIYTNAGDIRIWPSALYNNPAPDPYLEQCENTGTVFSYNTAGTNGGGLNTHIGRLDVRFANVHDNKAGITFNPSTGAGGGNGGGMFCEGPHADLSGYTVRLIHTDLNDNKAYGSGGSGNDLTGRGGGLYLKYGSIFAEHCDILRNEADINGGGLDNHDGELRVYGSFVDHNKAKKGRGGGLYTDKGNLVVGPCDSYGFVNSKASRICNNTAFLNGGGINNHEGGITIHGDRINNNTALTGKGGGVYINSGFINMYGGQINNNHADDPSGGYGGGVYGGGGTFKIMEREAHPILEILEVEKIATDGFTVHFHHVDRGYAMESGATDKQYGIAFSTSPYPTDLNENVEWTVGTGTSTDWTGVTKVSFNPTSLQPTPSAPHSYNQYEGCSRFVVNNSTLSGTTTTISSNTTYYVVAYGKYTYGGKNYFDASPVVTVKTYGDLPVVVTGVGFDITSTSASVNGKLFYGGASAVTAKGIEIKEEDASTWTTLAATSVGNVFSVIFEGLSPNTKYIARAYATNSHGTAYGDETTFTTASGKMANATGQAPRNIYPAVEKNPFFQELTPLQQAVLANTPEEDTTTRRSRNGRPSDEEPVNIPQINNNTATYGGGVCIDKQGARLIFSGKRGEIGEDGIGQINYNYASEAGGGIYIGKESADEYAKMQMMGKCEVNDNHVPAGKHGGGIYLDGRLYVGDKDTDPIGTHGLKVDNNWAVDGAGAGLPDGYAASGKLNNVFLTRYDYEYNANATEAGDNKVSVITLLSDISGYADAMNTNPHSHIGFSVLKGFCPVIATSDCFSKIVNEEEVDGNYNLHNYTPTGESASVSTETWLRNLMIMSGVTGGTGTADALTGAVFEDSESYVAVHTQSDIAPFRCKFIYLWGCWTHPIVKYDPEMNTGPEGNEDQSMVGTGRHYIIKHPADNTADGTGDPLEWEIYSPEGLAWFSAYVNGLNAFDEVTGATDDDDKHHAWHKDKNPYAIAHIMNDLDMSAYLWVPIGSVKYFFINNIGGNEQGGSLFVDSEKELTIGTHTYDNENHKFKGVFDGQGHVISGLQGLYLTGIKKYGLFGYLDENAVVKNTFVDDGLFVTDDKDVVYSGGGIAGKMDGGVLCNSEARMGFNVEYSAAGTAVGGLVGEVAGGSVHSSMAMPSMTGHDKGEGGDNPTFNAFEGYMGGLVGKLGSGCDLKNSFSNSGITLVNSDGATVNPAENSRHLGGLVGLNNGTVENCYSRYFGTTTPTGFGWFAGTNNYVETTVGSGDEQTTEITGVIKYCYAPNGETTYIGNNATTGLTGHGNYDPTVWVSGKYGFKHRDHKITAAKIDENEYTTLLITDIDDAYESGLTNQSFGGGGSNSGNNGSTSPQPATLSTTTSGGLMTILNAWVELNYKANEAGKDYATWTRTMASPINDDYPVPMLTDFNSVGSKDKIYLLYEDDINHMWNAPVMDNNVVTIPGKNFAACNTEGSVAAMYLYDVQPLNGDNKPADVTITNNAYVPLYINEEIGITQPDKDVDDNIPALTARAGVTIKNVREDGDDYTHDPNWHLFSSAIKKVPIGIEYHTATDQPYIENIVKPATQHFGHPHTTWSNRTLWDPPKTTWFQSDDQNADSYDEQGVKIGYFPTNTPYGTWRPGAPGGHVASAADGFFDLYEYSEFYYHWINYKREGTKDVQDHWHWDKDGVDAKHYRLGWNITNEDDKYYNDTEWVPGKGYLMALSSESMMMADGILNTGEVPVKVTNTPIGENLPPNGHGTYNYTTEWRALNMIGNPYQSYLDFDAFVSTNTGKLERPGYAVVDDSQGPEKEYRYIYYVNGQSGNWPYSASRYIHPHQGFFVKAASSGEITFNNDMRKAGKSSDVAINSPYRSEVNYPLVNLLCYDEDGRRDLTTVEVNRPEFGGGHKMEKLHESKGLIYAHLENESFQTLFTPVGVNVVPVRFVPNEDGIFTLNWNTRHGEFSYLHLIDNIAGVDVDCLTNDEYKFEGKTSDYKSRFKLVFRCDGDEPEDPEEPDDGDDSDHFAFMFGDELVVNGAGLLQMFDIQGRCLMETRAVGEQSSHRIPRVSAGVYLLRLTGESKVKVQKMVIK